MRVMRSCCSYRLLRRPTPPVLTDWLVTFSGRDRGYDITSARSELGYTPKVDVADGLAEMTVSLDANRRG